MKNPSFDESDEPPYELTLSRRDAREAMRLLSLLATGGETQSHQKLLSSEARIKRARQAISDRRKRTGIFGSTMFGEAAWDMLLILYAEQDVLGSHTVTKLGDMAGAAATTALRWLDHLERTGLVRRDLHPHDGRIVVVELSEKGRELLDSYFSETLKMVR